MGGYSGGDGYTVFPTGLFGRKGPLTGIFFQGIGNLLGTAA